MDGMEDKEYKYPEQSVIDQIENLIVCDRFSFSCSSNGYHIHTESDFSYMKFQGLSVLQGYLKIAEILGVENGDETSRYKFEGCPTCDFGAKYSVSLKFW
jgi:hypothetical protein